MYKPRIYKPRIYKPRMYKPRMYKPRMYKPRMYKPRMYKPRMYKPRTYKPHICKPRMHKPHLLQAIVDGVLALCSWERPLNGQGLGHHRPSVLLRHGLQGKSGCGGRAQKHAWVRQKRSIDHHGLQRAMMRLYARTGLHESHYMCMPAMTISRVHLVKQHLPHQE